MTTKTKLLKSVQKVGLKINQSTNGKVFWEVCNTLHLVEFSILLRPIAHIHQCYWFIWEKDHYFLFSSNILIGLLFTKWPSSSSCSAFNKIWSRWLPWNSTRRSNMRSPREFLSGEFLKVKYTPNANMADHSVAARDELYESEASEASVFCFDNASPEKSCFVVDLACFISPWLRVLCFWMPPEGSEIFHRRQSVFFSLPVHLWGENRRRKGVRDRPGNWKSLFATFQAGRS